MIVSSWKRRRERGADYAKRALGGMALILMHEADALSGHVAELRERIAVARKSRGLGELARHQLDLLPETRARLGLDQRERSALINGLIADLGYRRRAARRRAPVAFGVGEPAS